MQTFLIAVHSGGISHFCVSTCIWKLAHNSVNIRPVQDVLPRWQSWQMERQHMAQTHLWPYQQSSSQNSCHSPALYDHGLQHVSKEASCIQTHCCCLTSRPVTAHHASHPAQSWMSPPPLLLPGQPQPKAFVPYLPPVAWGLPGPQALEPTTLQLPMSAEEGQLCVGTITALLDCLLVLQQGTGVQHWGLAEELISEGHLQQSRKPCQQFPGPCLLHVSVCGWIPLDLYCLYYLW